MRSHLLATFAAVVAALGLSAAPALGETTTLYTLPAGVNGGSGLTSDAAGNVWFSTADANAASTPRVGRFVPAQGVADTDAGITLWSTPTYLGASCCATQVRSLDFDDEAGRLWFARSDGQYGYGDAAQMAAGSATPFQTAVHPNKIALWGVAYDPKIKRTWIAEYGATNVAEGNGNRPGNRIASADSGLGLTELPNLAQQGGLGTFTGIRYDAKPRAVAPDGAGEAWFVQSDPGNPGYRIGRTNGGGYLEYLIEPCLGVSPCSGTFSGTGPSDLTVGADGAVWFTNQVNNSIGKLDPAALTFTSYAVSSFGPGLSGGRPFAIRAAPDGSIWVAEFGGVASPSANAIIKITPGATTTATVYKTGSDGPLAVEPTASGDVYYLINTTSAPGKLGRLSGAVTVPSGGPGGGNLGEQPAPGVPTPGVPTPIPNPVVTPVVIKPASVGRAKISPPSGDTVRITQICVGPPQDKCSLVYLLDTNEYVAGFPGTKESLFSLAARAPSTKKPKSKKPKSVELGRTEVVLSGGQTADVQVRLSKKARTLLKKRKTLKVTLRVMEKQPDGTLRKVSSKKLTFKVKKAKQK